jgi:purine-binding chemotaxis protein CheW
MNVQEDVRESWKLPELELPLCSFYVGERVFGIDTKRVREVLSKRTVQRVPLAPAYVGGIVPYRGDVLTTVSLRAVLGMRSAEKDGHVLVIEDDRDDSSNHGEERFGLMVDRVGGVMVCLAGSVDENPSTLEERERAVFDGAYRTADGLLVRLCAESLKPVKLRASGLWS